MSRRQRSPTTIATPLALIPSAVLDQFADQRLASRDDLASAARQFRKAVVERALGAELNERFGYSCSDRRLQDHPTHLHSGTNSESIRTHSGPPMEIPRYDRRQIVKRERHFAGVDHKIVALYARGLTLREIQAFLEEMYGVEISLDLIGAVTDTIAAEVISWRSRPLETMYPVVFFDALRVKIRDDAAVRAKSVYLALALLADGTRDILGLWVEQNKDPGFWQTVFADLKTRGCHDILIAVADRPDGVSEAVEAVFPTTTLQPSIAQLIRHSLDFANWKERKALAAALRPIYAAESAEAAMEILEAFAQGPWGARFPPVVASWQRAWPQVVPLFSLPPEVRRLVYTTNTLENLRARLRSVVQGREHFRSDEAAIALIRLALRDIAGAWIRPAVQWKAARNQFAILYGDRFTRAEV